MHRVVHFGSVLQAYALQRVLQQMGIDNEIIDYVYPNSWHLPQRHRCFVVDFLYSMRDFVIHIVSSVRKDSSNETNKIRLFIDKYLIKSRFEYNTVEELADKCPKYDVYLTGSDQVWNTDYLRGDTSFFFSFVNEPHAKKVSYAASFGRFTLDGEDAKKWLSHLNSYSAISVREVKAAEIIRRYIGRSVEVVLDPTLLLSKQDWLNFSQTINNQSRPYILVYVLTYAWDPFPFAESVIVKYQKELGCRVVVLEPISLQESFPDWIYMYNVSPQEFVWLFANAELIITTSFHGTAFSVNLETSFYTIHRENGVNDDRISSLLEAVGLTDRLIYNNAMVPDFTKPNFEMAKGRLHTLRQQSLDYLSRNLC